MYENPKLNRVGKAEEVILGIIDGGADLDGNFVPSPYDFGPDEDRDED